MCEPTDRLTAARCVVLSKVIWLLSSPEQTLPITTGLTKVVLTIRDPEQLLRSKCVRTSP